MKKAYIEASELERMTKERDEVTYPSFFNFLKNHKGIRQGQLHSIIAATGSSKSTLVRSIVVELAARAKVLLLLNEESAHEYMLDVNNSLREKISDEAQIKGILENISIIHETDDEIPTESKTTVDQISFFDFIKLKIAKTGAKIFIYDNVTSGFIPRLTPSMQNKASEELIGLCRRMNLASIIVLHTVKDLKPNVMTRSEHVRGVNIFPINSSFVYTLTMFSYDGRKRAVLWNTKARGYPEADGCKYELVYNPKNRMYVSDKKMNEQDLIEIFEWINPKRGR